MRIRVVPRRIIITDGHEHQAVAELKAEKHTRVGRFLRRIVGWPVARRTDTVVPLHHPHSHAAHPHEDSPKP